MIIIAKKISVKEKYVPGPEVKAELQKVYDMGFWYNFKEAIWALLVPIIILGGIYSGVFLLPRLRLWPVCMHFLQVCSFIRT